MNKAQLIGRTTKEIELRYTTGENSMAVARFTLAVNRKGKQKDKADFISCVAFGKAAETLDKYVSKGHRIGIVGHIQTGSYDHKDGYKVYTTDVVVDEFEFLESKKDDQDNSQAQNQTEPSDSSDDGIPEGFHEIEDDDLPF